MERRNSNISASAARAGRRRSAVTIIAPGEETNPFHPEAATDAAQTNARFDDFKPPVRPEEAATATAGTTIRGLPPPPPAPAAGSAPVRTYPYNVTPAPTTFANATRPPVAVAANRASSNNITQPDATSNGVNARRSNAAPGKSTAATAAATGGGRMAQAMIENTPNTAQVLNSASRRLQGLHMFPNTPPASVMAAVSQVPPPRPVNPRTVNNAMASQFPANPNQSSANGIRTEQRPPPQQQRSPQREMDRNNTNATPNASASASRTRRGSDPQPTPSHAPGAAAPAASWTSAARRQSLNASAPNVAAYADTASAGGMRNGTAARRVTVPQVSPPRQRVDLVRVPHPPSRRSSVNEQTSSGSSTNSTSVLHEEEKTKHGEGEEEAKDNVSKQRDEEGTDEDDGSETPSLFPSRQSSGASKGSGSALRNDSFNFLGDGHRDSSIVIDDANIDEEQQQQQQQQRDEASTSPSSSPSDKRRARDDAGSRSPAAPVPRQPSPLADTQDFLRTSARGRMIELDMAPLSPQKSKPRPSKEERDNGDKDRDREESEGRSSGQEEGESRTTNASTTSHSPDTREPPSDSDFSAIMESPSYFSPLLDRSRDKKSVPPVHHVPAGDNSLADKSAESLADFGLTSNDTLDPVTFALNAQAHAALTSTPSTSTSISASQPPRRSRPAVRLPSPVDLNSMLLRTAAKTTPTSAASGSPASRSDSHRANIAHSHASKQKHSSNHNNSSGSSNKNSRSVENQDSLADSSLSMDNWSLVEVGKNGLSNETQTSEERDTSPLRLPGFASRSSAATARSPTSKFAKASSAAGMTTAEEKWRVTQSLSLDVAEYSFDHLPLDKQSSTVAKLKKVFESQKKGKREDSDALTSGHSGTASFHSQSPRRKEPKATPPPPLNHNSLAMSTGSTVVAPRSVTSSDDSMELQGAASQREDGETNHPQQKVQRSSSSAVDDSPATAASMDFSFDRLTPPSGQNGKMMLPPIYSNARSNPAVRPRSATRSEASDADFRFSWGTSMENAALANRHSAPSRSAPTRNASGTLPSISVPGSDGNFSLARFQNSNASVDTVNMFDRYEFLEGRSS